MKACSHVENHPIERNPWPTLSTLHSTSVQLISILQPVSTYQGNLRFYPNLFTLQAYLVQTHVTIASSAGYSYIVIPSRLKFIYQSLFETSKIAQILLSRLVESSLMLGEAGFAAGHLGALARRSAEEGRALVSSCRDFLEQGT